MVSQLVISYGANKRIERPWNITWSSFGGKTAERIHKNSGWDKWPVLLPYPHALDSLQTFYDLIDVRYKCQKNHIWSCFPRSLLCILRPMPIMTSPTSIPTWSQTFSHPKIADFSFLIVDSHMVGLHCRRYRRPQSLQGSFVDSLLLVSIPNLHDCAESHSG